MATYPGYDNPQLILDTGYHTTVTVECHGCGQTVDTTRKHWTLTTGRSPRFDQLAVAHHAAYADGGGACFLTLKAHWLNLAANHRAGMLDRRHPDGYWTLLGDDLHCGTPLQILTADGTWIDGHYELIHTPRGPQPVLFIALGGLNRPDAPLDIPTHALLRNPQ